VEKVKGEKADWLVTQNNFFTFSPFHFFTFSLYSIAKKHFNLT